MNKKEIALFSIIIGVLVGTLISVLQWDYNNDKAHFKKQCEQIVKISNAEQHHVEYGECYMVKDGKLIKVDL